MIIAERGSALNLNHDPVRLFQPIRRSDPIFSKPANELRFDVEKMPLRCPPDGNSFVDSTKETNPCAQYALPIWLS